MGQRVYIEVFDRITGEKYIAHGVLPLQIGKKPESENHICLDPKYETISRVHGLLKAEDDHLLFIDQSSNGTLVNGVFLRDSASRVSKKDIIQIENYNLRLVDFAPFIIKHTLPDLSEVSELAITAGLEAEIALVEGGMKLRNPVQTMPEESTKILRIWFEEQNIYCEQTQSSSDNIVILNKAVVPEGAFKVNPFDVLEIDGQRFEFLTPDEPKIVCGNVSCHLLNELDFEENCKWCGYHLAGAGGLTRVARSS